MERRDIDTQIDILCAPKPGLLLSTVNTLEALGLEIQQCVISCFNDFSMHASCSEVCTYICCLNCLKLAMRMPQMTRSIHMCVFSYNDDRELNREN